MSNTVGLLLIGLGIGGLVVFVILVDYVANNFPDTKIGRICKALSSACRTTIEGQAGQEVSQ